VYNHNYATNQFQQIIIYRIIIFALKIITAYFDQFTNDSEANSNIDEDVPNFCQYIPVFLTDLFIRSIYFLYVLGNFRHIRLNILSSIFQLFKQICIRNLLLLRLFFMIIIRCKMDVNTFIYYIISNLA